MATRELGEQGLLDDTMGPLRREFMSSLGVLEEDMTILMWGEDGKPPHSPACPACRDSYTSWRGPHPSIGSDPPITMDKDGYESAHIPGRFEARSDAMMRLYRIADIHKNSPFRMDSVAAGLVMWQSALCSNCDLGHIERWFMEMFERNSSGGYTEHRLATKHRKTEDDPT
jgi:hypothetical protein